MDLNEITSEISDIEQKLRFKSIVQNLPAECPEDLSVEVSRLEFEDGDFSALITGHYYPISDQIKLKAIYSEVLIHELGHALDYNGYFSNTSLIGANSKFKEVNPVEMKAYLEAVNKCYDDNEEQSSDKYCTKNDKEMFAECYQLLMTGEDSSKEVILKYFPKTLQAVAEHLKEIRKFPDSKRH